jgi:hypothetical protein
MRSLRRIPLSAFLSIFAFLFFLLIPARSAQTPLSSPPALQSGAQSEAATALPAEWSAGEKVLAERIAAAVKPSRAISLAIKNISSLGAAEVEAIRAALEAGLQTQGLRIGAGGTDVEVTFSENVEGLVWVAQIRAEGKAPLAAIVSIARPPAQIGNEGNASLVLSRELIWQQPARFLDFSVFYGIPGAMYSMLVILEPDRLNYYQSRIADWNAARSVNFPKAEPKQRDPRGRIANAENTVYAPGIRCTGDVQDPAKLECALWKDLRLTGARIKIRFPGHDANDESAIMADRCANKMVAFASGNGDWTQPDSLQAYLVGDFREDGKPSGSAVEFDGPVLVLHGEGKNVVRVIAHNLKTGNYEGYIVTATCSQ